MSSLRKSLAKAKAKAKNLLHPAEKPPGQQTEAHTTESRPSGVTTNRLKHSDQSSSSLSSPASVHNDTQEPQTQPADAISLGPGLSARPDDVNPSSSQQSLSTTLVSNPWEAWTLDRDFLYQVYIWNSNHPENTLNRVFKKTSTAIEKHEILLELVPDGPIPIRGFVKALAHVVKLGTDMAVAKMAALEFAQSVLKWIEKLAAALGEGGSGRFISGAWENLADIRELIEGVCIWAHRMLNIGLMERASVKERILEFQQQFTQAIERFGVISNIQIGIGQDQIYQRLDSLHNDTNQQFQSLRDHLEQPQVNVPDATYQVQHKIPCDPGTRKQVLEEIMTWVSDISEGSPCFFWLSGDPGVGKSAVTASIAQECKRRKILWAQFFINRNEASTTDPQLYFPAIVKQMSEHKSAVAYTVQTILKDQPDLLKDDIYVQASELFLKAVRAASESTPQEPIAIVIDALDETDLKRLKATAEVFSHILVDLPRNVKVFISSRVENVIRDNFNSHPRARNIHLSARTSVADVTQFLETKVDEIMVEFHIDHSHWGNEHMRKLCSQAAGLFIWAVTAIAYLRAQIEDFGTERLAVVLDELNAHGMNNINVLYMAILKRTYQREACPWQTQCFQRIMGAILAQQSPLSINDLKGLLDLRNPTIGTTVDVEHFVRRLRTVLVPGNDGISGQTIPRVHKSFVDFITSADAQEFCVNVVASHGELALQCIRRLVRVWEDKISKQLPGQLHYAISHWASHLTGVVGVPVEQEEPVLEDDAKSINDELTLPLKSNPEKNKGMSGSLDPQPTNQGGRLHTGIDGISISPDGTRICYAYGQSLLLRDIETGDFIGGPLNGHTEDVRLATFSPDGRHIVSASYDKTIRIWDVETGAPVGDPLQGHTGWVNTAAFSPDGRQIVSSSEDKTACIWDAETHQMLHQLKEGHSYYVHMALFSPDARHVVTSSGEKTICLLNTTTGKAVYTLDGHDMLLRSAFFSPDGKNIISYSVDGTIVIWDSETGTRIPEYFTSLGSTNAKLAFTNSGASSYIETPLVPMVKIKNEASQPSYVFRVGEDGLAGGVSNGWLYANKKYRFAMSTHLGQLIMTHTWG